MTLNTLFFHDSFALKEGLLLQAYYTDGSLQTRCLEPEAVLWFWWLNHRSDSLLLSNLSDELRGQLYRRILHFLCSEQEWRRRDDWEPLTLESFHNRCKEERITFRLGHMRCDYIINATSKSMVLKELGREKAWLFPWIDQVLLSGPFLSGEALLFPCAFNVFTVDMDRFQRYALSVRGKQEGIEGWLSEAGLSFNEWVEGDAFSFDEVPIFS